MDIMVGIDILNEACKELTRAMGFTDNSKVGIETKLALIDAHSILNRHIIKVLKEERKPK